MVALARSPAIRVSNISDGLSMKLRLPATSPVARMSAGVAWWMWVSIRPENAPMSAHSSSSVWAPSASMKALTTS